MIEIGLDPGNRTGGIESPIRVLSGPIRTAIFRPILTGGATDNPDYPTPTGKIRSSQAAVDHSSPLSNAGSHT
ncbi:uncharacterized protein BO87DRAFT_160870 [Aspergillus neoniger CBS 115656]|uniref:Uncharacterized protein n=1 Tax=Aspergillus neoniger (strain CBS 115656) TaxID=1448310 RepID=A0A318Y9J1_ASPNB|nr:hypothetical protein BO87DRAFT_160870 [Aspergillus neoniger CBS 115656]PYH30227.1 hypothetical protein BO87DRAFT_160870 [Aspergillus neoniger CBS 115656]